MNCFSVFEDLNEEQSDLWEGKMGKDAGHGEWVYLNNPGHQFHLMMFKCYYEGYNTYTLKYGKRAVVCNRENFIKKEDMSNERLHNLQMAEAMRRHNEDPTEDIRRDRSAAS